MNWLDLNWIDIFLLLIIAASVLEGLRTGLARVVIGLVALSVGIIAGFWMYALVAAKIAFIIPWPLAANILGFCIVFFGVLLIGGLLSIGLSKIFTWTGLSWLNHLLGGLAGALRGLVIAAALVTVFLAFMPAPMPESLTTSRVMPYAIRVSGLIAEFAPYSLKVQVQTEIKKLKQVWIDVRNTEWKESLKEKETK